MTKERKLEILKDLLIQLSDSANILCTCEADERCEVVEECINALEQQPCEDCVSRAEMLKYQQYLYGKMPNEENQKLWEFIKALPPVTPTRKSGLHWIERFDNESMWLECPHCHMDSIAAYNYCPNCGASFKEDKRGNSDGSN